MNTKSGQFTEKELPAHKIGDLTLEPQKPLSELIFSSVGLTYKVGFLYAFVSFRSCLLYDQRRTNPFPLIYKLGGAGRWQLLN